MPIHRRIATPLDAAGFVALGDYVRKLVAHGFADLPAAVREAFDGGDGPVHVGFRNRGRLFAEQWLGMGEDGVGSWADALVVALAAAVDEARQKKETVSTVEIIVCHSPRPIADHTAEESADRNWLFANVRRGVNALEIERSPGTQAARTDRISPYYVIARNRGFATVLEEYREQKGLTEADWRACKLTAYRTWQILVPVSLSRNGPAVPRWRGTSLVPPKAVTKRTTEALATLLGDYLFGHVDEEGHLTYALDPAEGEDVDRTDNNMIRQWMATCAMNRAAAYRDKDRELYAIVERNIRYNLRQYYRELGSIGLIEFDDEINLGSVALAVQGLMEHPNRASFAEAERKLLNAVQWCWDQGRGTGQFATYIQPLNMDLKKNFFPGEALLTWSMVYRETKDPKLKEQFFRSFDYYKEWHLKPANRRPAFVPWHVQAYFNMWEMTGDERLADFIYLMSDWLCGVQTKRTVHPDAAGQFFDPRRPHFGPPHSSSTGVYIEGLIDSYELAKRQGDAKRRERYRQALVRGIRNIMQFTFKDELECFYGFDPPRLLGGTRSNAFHNRVRCDNVQHNLMGIMKVLKRFEDGEYALPTGPLTVG